MEYDSPVYLKIERAIASSNAEEGSQLIRSHLEKYWVAGAAKTHKSVLYSLRNHIEFQRSRIEPVYEWDMASVLIALGRLRSIIVGKYAIRIEKCKIGNSKSDAKTTPKSHLYNYVSDFRKIVRITGISCLNPTDCEILNIESGEWGNVYQRPRIQDGQIPTSPLTVGGGLVSDPSRDLKERLFAWPFRVDVAEGLWRCDLLNTPPPRTVLMKEGLVGFAEKTQTRGKSEGRPWGEVVTHFLTKSGYVKGVECSKMILGILGGAIG